MEADVSQLVKQFGAPQEGPFCDADSTPSAETLAAPVTDEQQSHELTEEDHAACPAIIAKIGGVSCLDPFVADKNGGLHWRATGWFVSGEDIAAYDKATRRAERYIRRHAGRLAAAPSDILRKAARNSGIGLFLDVQEHPGVYAEGRPADRRGVVSVDLVFGQLELDAEKARPARPASALDSLTAAWQKDPSLRIATRGRRQSSRPA